MLGVKRASTAMKTEITIRDPKACLLIEEIAQQTGADEASVLTNALEEKLDRLQQTRKTSRIGLAEKLVAIGKVASSLPVLDPRPLEEMLYGANGTAF
jgi:hypothetical protein